MLPSKICFQLIEQLRNRPRSHNSHPRLKSEFGVGHGIPVSHCKGSQESRKLCIAALLYVQKYGQFNGPVHEAIKSSRYAHGVSNEAKRLMAPITICFQSRKIYIKTSQ